MIRILLAGAALASCLATPAYAFEMPSRELVRPAAAPATFRAPHVGSHQSLRLAPVMEKLSRVAEHPGGRLEVGVVRALPKAADVLEWTPVAGGYVATLDVSSPDSEGLRSRLDLTRLATPLEIRVQGTDGRIYVSGADALAARESWTPYTAGETQRIELFSAHRPDPGAVRLGAVVHFAGSPLAKAAASCTVSSLCTTNDPALDAAIAQRRKSVMRINYIDGGRSYLCSATLVNTDKFPTAYVLTANHCIDNAVAASTIASFWNYESTACDDATPNPNYDQVSGGMQLVFTNYNIDGSLLLMNQSPPAGAVFAGFSSAPLASGAAVVSLSHPDGDTMRLALGTASREYGVVGRPQLMQGVKFTRGIIQGGSSGSGLFTLANGQLQMRGILSATTVREGGMSCTTTTEEGLYGSLATFLPQMQPFVSVASLAADDAPNRIQDVSTEAFGSPLRVGEYQLANLAINRAGDLDVFKFTLTSPALVTVRTTGTANLDTIGNILDVRGVVLGSDGTAGETLAANDDAQAADNHFGITRRLREGTYYVQVGHYDPDGTGAYNLRVRVDNVDTNYTSLWYNALEPGWGININHQLGANGEGEIVFAALFTYDRSGAPLWLTMSRGLKQPDGSFQGELFRVAGPAFNATSWGSIAPVQVGTMRLNFGPTGTAQLTYTFDGATVTKTITRQKFGASLPTCGWSFFDRAYDENYQDLWWNPSENGWGVNIAHQNDTLFATLFTYGSSGQPVWYVMSAGNKTSSGVYSGTLYRASGPAFNAATWPAIGAAGGTVLTPVGNMTLRFDSRGRGTLTYTVDNVTVTKPIERQVFGALKPSCES